MGKVKWPLHDKKNPFFWPKNFEIQNLPLIHLPIYKSIFFSGSSEEKKEMSLVNPRKRKWYGNPQFCSDWAEIDPIRKD